MPLNAAAHLLESFSEQIDLVVFIYDLSARQFSYLNPAFEKVWRMKRETVLENPAALLQTIHSEDQAHVREMYQELVAGAIVDGIEFRIQVQNKTERWVSVKPLLQKEQEIITGYVNDVTVQKQYTDNLKKFTDKKNAILNILSHDLAGPLGMISSIANVLASDLKANQSLLDLIQIIQRSSQQGTRLIQEFIKQEFLESAGVELVKRRVELVKTMRESLIEYQQNQQMTGKTFQYLPTCDMVYLELDDTKFMQAINNLLSNALKFTPDGGKITVVLEAKESSVLIKVTDTGIGIPEQYHATLFDKFTNARRPGIRGEPSVGLGMSIIKTIVEWHQGQIWFESKENQGTTFSIEIPKT